jgi:hypothetical protein
VVSIVLRQQFFSAAIWALSRNYLISFTREPAVEVEYVKEPRMNICQQCLKVKAPFYYEYFTKQKITSIIEVTSV